MPVLVQCDCGKQFQVPDSVAGKRIRCKYCQEPVRVPQPSRAAPVRSKVRSTPKRDQPEEDFGDEDVETYEPPRRRRPRDDDHADDQIQRDLERIQRQTNSAASRPGMLRVNYVRYVLAFPKWALIWHISLVVSAVLTFLVHWGFGFLLAFILFCVYLYWRGVRNPFISGCINPGQVVSLDPPLVAAYTNLSKGGADCHAIKILPQPLAKMCTGHPEKNQQVGTIAVYSSLHNELQHWDDFFPVVADIVTGREDECDRILDSCDDSDWDLLESGIKQLPRPFEPGMYRIYPETDKPAEVADETTIAELVEDLLPFDESKNCYGVQDDIPGEILDLADETYAEDVEEEDILVLLASDKIRSEADTGMLLTVDGVRYDYPETDGGEFQWAELRGAFVDVQVLELTLKSGQRLRIPTGHFHDDVLVRLEQLFNEICNDE